MASLASGFVSAAGKHVCEWTSERAGDFSVCNCHLQGCYVTLWDPQTRERERRLRNKHAAPNAPLAAPFSGSNSARWLAGPWTDASSLVRPLVVRSASFPTVALLPGRLEPLHSTLYTLHYALYARGTTGGGTNTGTPRAAKRAPPSSSLACGSTSGARTPEAPNNHRMCSAGNHSIPAEQVRVSAPVLVSASFSQPLLLACLLAARRTRHFIVLCCAQCVACEAQDHDTNSNNNTTTTANNK